MIEAGLRSIIRDPTPTPTHPPPTTTDSLLQPVQIKPLRKRSSEPLRSDVHIPTPLFYVIFFFPKGVDLGCRLLQNNLLSQRHQQGEWVFQYPVHTLAQPFPVLHQEIEKEKGWEATIPDRKIIAVLGRENALRFGTVAAGSKWIKLSGRFSAAPAPSWL